MKVTTIDTETITLPESFQILREATIQEWYSKKSYPPIYPHIYAVKRLS